MVSRHSLNLHKHLRHSWQGRGVLQKLKQRDELTSNRELKKNMRQKSKYLFTIRLVHQENLTPYLNASRLPLRPSPPGKTSQRLVVISNPVHCFLQVGTKEALKFSCHFGFTLFLCVASTPALERGIPSKSGFPQGSKCEHLCSKATKGRVPLETH